MIPCTQIPVITTMFCKNLLLTFAKRTWAVIIINVGLYKIFLELVVMLFVEI